MDVSSLALVRALMPQTAFLAEASLRPAYAAAIVDISSSVSTLVVAVDDVLKFTRVINFSSDRFARVMSEQVAIPVRRREHPRAAGGLAGPLPAEGGRLL